MLFTLAVKDNQEFDIAKFIWERKYTMAAQKLAEIAQN